MRTRREVGQLLFGGVRSTAPGRSSASSGYSQRTSMARGTLQQDTWSDESSGLRASILVDGDDEPGEYGVDNDMAEGQRVKILFYGAQATVLPDGDVIARQAERYADSNIQQAKTDLQNEIEKRGETIKQDAVRTSKTYTDESIGSFSRTVADTYASKQDLGSYATTSDLNQTSESITATFTEALAEKGSIQIGQPSPPYSVGDVWIDPDDGIAYTCTRARQSGSYSSSDWQASDAFISTFVRQDVDGVTVGRDGGWLARVSALGRYEILDESEDAVLQIGVNNGTAYVTSALDDLTLRSVDGYAVVQLADGMVRLSSMYGVTMDASTSSIGYSPSDFRVMGAVTIYANASGTTGTVSLSRAVTYFHVVEIFYGDQNGRILSHRVCGRASQSGIGHIENGTTTNIFQYVANSSTGYLKSTMLTLSGSTITQSNSYGDNIGNSGVLHNAGDLRIFAVLGWSA